MRFAVVRFGGSNCDRDTWHVLQEVLGVDTDLVWYKEGFPRACDAVVLPGGFSYGDYLRAGAIAARTPVMQDIHRHVREGKLVLGICNGAQMSAEAGLVEGTFAVNAYPKFLCRPVYLRVETATSPFTSRFREGEVIRLPIAHKEGRFITPPETMAALNREHRVAFRFCDGSGKVSEATNHNGSLESVTGVLGQNRNVLALMPHPERASEEVLGSGDGRRIFESMIRHVEVEG